MAGEPQNGVQKLFFAAYLVLIFSLGFMKPQVDARFFYLTPTDLVFPVLILFGMVCLVRGAVDIKYRPAYLPVLFYLLTLVPSVLFSVNQSLSVKKFATVTYVSVLALLTINLITSADRLKYTVFAWLLGAVAPVAIGLTGIVIFYVAPGSEILGDITYHPGAVPVGNFPRLSSTFISASMFCNYLTVSFVLGLIAVRAGWLRPRVGFLFLTLIALVVLFTVSIAIGGLFFAVALWFWRFGTGKIIPLYAPVLGLVVAAAFLATAFVDLSSLVANQGLVPSSRMLVWTDAVRTFLESPVTGKGLGTGAARVTYMNSDGTWSVLIDAHNSFLNVASEAGAVGLIGLIVLTAAVTRSAFVGAGRDTGLTLFRAGLGIAFLSAFVYDGLTGSFEDARHLWILIGLVLAVDRMAPTLQPEKNTSR